MRLSFFKKAFVATVAVALSCAAWADKTYYQSDTTEGRKWWFYVNDAGKAVIEHENSSDTHTAAISTAATGNLTIPSKVYHSSTGWKDVAGIGRNAFYNCGNITGVTIPSGVTSIEYCAFAYCGKLGTVTIPEGVKSLGEYAFYSCVALETATLPDSLEEIWNFAFSWCLALESITIPNNVTFVAARAFWNCTVLESVTFGTSLATIGAYAFQDCKYLESVDIPATVTFLGNDAFNGCESLENVTLPADLVTATVKTRCFSGCSAELEVKSVEVSGGLTWHFRIVDGGAELCWDSENDAPTISVATSGHVTIPATLGSGVPVVGIGDEAFSECSYITGMTIPATVKSIGESAFDGCSSLVLAVPDTVTSIGDGAFCGCYAMADANGFVIVRGVLHFYTDKDYYPEIPYGVTRIGSWAFLNCNISGVTIPATVTSIGRRAFANSYLDSIDIPASVTSIGDMAFQGCYWLQDDDGFVIVRNVVYDYYGSDSDVVIPGGVTSISPWAFLYHAAIESVIFPASLTSIGTYAFAECNNLEAVAIPSSVTSIGRYAFVNKPAMILVTGLKWVYVEPGDTARVKTLLAGSMPPVVDVNAITFVEGVPHPFTVTFDAQGGSVSPATRLVTSGMPVGELPVPVRADKLFVGWFTALNGGTEVTADTLITADATYYARWTDSMSGIWYTRRADALAAAKHSGKKVFLIRGRDTCGNTMYTKNVSCEDPAVKTKLIAKCELWYCNIDGPYEEESRRYKSADATLPLVCVIDPDDAENFVKRSNGPLDPAGVLALIGDVPYPPVVDPETDPEALDPFYPGEMSGYTVLNPADIWDPVNAPKGDTLQGAAYYGNDVVGLVELKIGKLKDQNGKISGSVTTLDGKKYTIKSKKTSFGSEYATVLYLDVKTLGEMRIAIGRMGGKNVFSGSLTGSQGAFHVQSANVGGAWAGSTATVSVALGDTSAFPGVMLDALLPAEEVASASGGKWTFKKAAGVKWVKIKDGAAIPAIYDEESKKGLVIDTSKDKTNVSGLKLTYTPKKGTFKGSFKGYALEGTGAKTKLKKYTFNINGVVVDGKGYGAAISKKPAANWKVTVQ